VVVNIPTREMSREANRYINKDKIIQFITEGLNRTPAENAYGYDAIEILTEIEYSDEVDFEVLKKEIEQKLALRIMDQYLLSMCSPERLAEYKEEFGL
jgi:hypothetical protein